jgi:hypothetical protein
LLEQALPLGADEHDALALQDRREELLDDPRTCTVSVRSIFGSSSEISRFWTRLFSPSEMSRAGSRSVNVGARRGSSEVGEGAVAPSGLSMRRSSDIVVS